MLECLMPLFASEGLVAEVLELKRASGDGRVVHRFFERATARFAHPAPFANAPQPLKPLAVHVCLRTASVSKRSCQNKMTFGFLI